MGAVTLLVLHALPEHLWVGGIAFFKLSSENTGRLAAHQAGALVEGNSN
jgi:hypothetical protein